MAAMDESLLQLRAVWQKDLFENVVPFGSTTPGHGAKDDQGLLFFSLSRDGSERLHLQRKPYAAVFYVQGKLSYWRMLKVIEDEGGSHGEDAAAVLASAEAMFETLLEWIEDPSKLGCSRRQPTTTEERMSIS
ncbi:RNA lariat debranching enzyme [Aureococcus anophagefferens]|nr:RNA lariat debranching enzyme [Aureococcus anophagefferens]